MADQAIRALSDDELKAIADSPEMVAELTSSERRRLHALKPFAKPTDVSGAALAGGGGMVPKLATAAAAFATSPTAPKVGSAIGKVVGGIAPAVGGALEAGPVGALAGLAAASKGAWAGGKTGYFTTKLGQAAASPVASALEKLTPFAQSLGTLGGATGVGDLASIAEPNRADTTILGKSMGDAEIMGILQQKAAAGDTNAQQSLAYLKSIGK